MTFQAALGDPRIAIIGLGYAGLPLAAEFVDALYRRIITAGSPATAPNLNCRANDANIPAQ